MKSLVQYLNEARAPKFNPSSMSEDDILLEYWKSWAGAYGKQGLSGNPRATKIAEYIMINIKSEKDDDMKTVIDRLADMDRELVEKNKLHKFASPDEINSFVPTMKKLIEKNKEWLYKGTGKMELDV